jgi:squalene-hopene/tetraprenyl-beta-curcumene cyclase
MTSAPPLRRVWPALLTIAYFTGFSATPVLRGDDIAIMRQKALQFLTTTQDTNGSWTKPDAVGISGLVVSSLLHSGRPVDDPVVANGLKFLASSQQPSGGIHAPASRHQNYETCIALLALSQANTDGRYNAAIKRAEEFLRGLQWDAGEGIETSDDTFGGAGYDSKQRPDMSNTQFLIEALRSAGAAPDDPALQKALIFVSRAQNLESPHNTLPWSGKINDGGFIYTPAKGGESKAPLAANGGHSSYGSMTYAGLKSMIYAGVKADDPRVVAAVKWIRSHYTLSENPGMGPQGLYYYYQTFAKTMSIVGGDNFQDAAGQEHDWRKEVTEKLKSLQKPNGSWINEADRWYEGDPNLVTAYCLIALSYCEKPAAN